MKREKNKAYTRNKIIESAFELFSLQDYQKTSVQEIAKKAGVTKTTFFAYFKSKEELLFGFDLEQMKVFEEQVALAMADRQELLTKLREAIVHMAVNLHKTQVITQNLIHLGTISSSYKKLLSEIFLMMHGVIAKAIEHGQGEGVVSKNISAEAISDHLVKIYIGVVVHWGFLKEDGQELSTAMNEMIECYYHGIKV